MNSHRLRHMPVFLLFAVLPLLSMAAPSLTEVRLAAQADGTRVVFGMTEATRQKVFTLDNPARVVIDLPATSLANNLAGKLPLGEGMVKNLRTAKRDNGDLRVVLDLVGAAQPSSSWLAGDANTGPRLIVDLPNASNSMAPVVANPTPPPALEARNISAPPVNAPAPINEPVPNAVKSSAAFGSGRDLIIAIDAGHGGEDPGAIGRRGAREKNITLAVARLLKERIDAEPGMRAVLTRDGDVFVPLRERIHRARQFQADMFVSIHADSVSDARVTGSSVYTLSPKGATNEAARWLADRENAADMVGGISLDNKNDVLASVLLDMSQGATMGASLDAGSRVLKQLDQMGNTHHSTVQQAGFVVLKSPDIPSMLVETAFISNPAEEARLSDPRHQARLANAVLSGVRDYFYANSPPGTRIAQLKATRQARLD